MCGLIARALERRDGRTRRHILVQASPQQKSPSHVVGRDPSTEPANPPPAGSKKREVGEDRLDEKSACDASERGGSCRGEEGGSAVTTTSGIILVGAQRESETPKAALRSPPRVRRVVTSHYPALPALARRSSARRDHHRRHKRARGGGKGRNERDTAGMSSAHLAEAIGCHNIPTGLRSAFDGQHDRDLHGNAFKLESMGNVFRAGLDLGNTRFRGAGTV